MRITLELDKNKYTVESDSNDYTADELKEMFSRLLVQATYPPSVIDLQEGGHYEYVEDEE